MNPSHFKFLRGMRGLSCALVRLGRGAGLGAAIPLFAAASFGGETSPGTTLDWGNSFVCGAGRLMGAGEEIDPGTGKVWEPRIHGLDEPLLRVVHDGARFVAISTNHLLVSPDGLAWTQVPAPSGFLDLAVGDGRLVGIVRVQDTQACRLVTSVDGVFWAVVETSHSLRRVRHADGVFVAVDESGRALSSVDGLTWGAAALADASGRRSETVGPSGR